MTTTNINTGVNSISVEKTGYNYRTRKARQIIAVVTDASGKTIDAIYPGEGSHRVALDWATWRANTIRNDYEEAATMVVFCGDTEIAIVTITDSTSTTPETEITTNTETTMTTTDTTDNAPKFEELTHAATNIVLTAENDGDIYRRYVEQLVNSLAKKVTKGVQLNASTLARSGAVTNIIRESIKGMKSSGWTDPVTTSDRKQAAAYLANVYISDAIENAEYINA